MKIDIVECSTNALGANSGHQIEPRQADAESVEEIRVLCTSLVDNCWSRDDRWVSNWRADVVLEGVSCYAVAALSP